VASADNVVTFVDRGSKTTVLQTSTIHASPTMHQVSSITTTTATTGIIVTDA
jgi:hypothetical protein